ncbi:AraC family transcriptional regulator [Elizabethkingia sp. JS20170427COW]|uniref:helix-turn-helix domain-containing protein n=1 Tax=Elizabethkingia sp. JS20170427COW TaxID=2583851 RepID=UPI00111067C5|nr:helix-turn-helix domain-containing protein [Elizabethkingia sp. JS20170427COW]QCX52281.1 helix-turn-helix domain-containing protein [Elizabethkingia sp. JS20170427COW]
MPRKQNSSQDKKEEKKITPSKTRVKTIEKEQFNILLHDHALEALPYVREGFYKLIFTTERYTFNKKQITVPSVFLQSNTCKNINIEEIQEHEGGFVCIFNSKFIESNLLKKIQNIFKVSSFKNLIWTEVDETKYSTLAYLFQNLFEEYNQIYFENNFKIKSLFQLTLSEIIQLYQSNFPEVEKEASLNVAQEFKALLEKQFPIESPLQKISFKDPNDFAHYLQIHVNHLNFVSKKEFGKTTSQVIQEVITQEACQLLLHTDWSILDICNVLGFEYPQHFNVYFKRNMKMSPLQYRQHHKVK